MNWREHPRLTITVLSLVAVTTLFFLARGCGCTGKTRFMPTTEAGAPAEKGRTPKAESKPGPKPTPKPEQDSDPDQADDAPPVAAAPTRANPKPAGGDDGDATKVEKPARPKEVGQWKRDDYYRAKQEGDAKLVEAVAWLGQHFAGKEPAAELLTRLLENGVDDPFEPETNKAAPAAIPNLTETLVAALVANGTPRARQTLEAVAAGTLKTADPQKAATLALAALAARPNENSEELLFRAATAQADPTGNATAIDIEKAHATALNLVKSSATPALRLRLARHAVSAETPQDVFDRVWTCLAEPRTENLAAQAVFYESDRTDEGVKASIEQQIAPQSAAALARLLGVVPPTRGQGKAELAAATLDASRAAEVVWGAPLADTIAQRLRGVSNLDRGAKIVRLAATIPSQPLRVAMFQLLERHWDDGPQTIESLASTDAVAFEPGFLLVLKKLPRRGAAPAGNSRSYTGGLSPAKAAKIAADREAKERNDKIAADWLGFSANVVATMCRQFHAAALLQKKTTRGQPDDLTVDLPFKPHPNAELAVAWRLDWPDGLEGKLAAAKVSPLRVRYLRFEQKATPSKLLAYYRRLLPSCAEHDSRRGVWFDSFTVDKDRGEARSIDVLISRANTDGPVNLTQEQRVVVEILSVEIERSSSR